MLDDTNSSVERTPTSANAFAAANAPRHHATTLPSFPPSATSLLAAMPLPSVPAAGTASTSNPFVVVANTMTMTASPFSPCDSTSAMGSSATTTPHYHPNPSQQRLQQQPAASRGAAEGASTMHALQPPSFLSSSPSSPSSPTQKFTKIAAVCSSFVNTTNNGNNSTLNPAMNASSTSASIMLLSSSMTPSSTGGGGKGGKEEEEANEHKISSNKNATTVGKSYRTTRRRGGGASSSKGAPPITDSGVLSANEGDCDDELLMRTVDAIDLNVMDRTATTTMTASSSSPSVVCTNNDNNDNNDSVSTATAAIATRVPSSSAATTTTTTGASPSPPAGKTSSTSAASALVGIIATETTPALVAGTIGATTASSTALPIPNAASTTTHTDDVPTLLNSFGGVRNPASTTVGGGVINGMRQEAAEGLSLTDFLGFAPPTTTTTTTLSSSRRGGGENIMSTTTHLDNNNNSRHSNSNTNSSHHDNKQFERSSGRNNNSNNIGHSHPLHTLTPPLINGQQKGSTLGNSQQQHLSPVMVMNRSGTSQNSNNNNNNDNNSKIAGGVGGGGNSSIATSSLLMRGGGNGSVLGPNLLLGTASPSSSSHAFLHRTVSRMNAGGGGFSSSSHNGSNGNSPSSLVVQHYSPSNVGAGLMRGGGGGGERLKSFIMNGGRNAVTNTAAVAGTHYNNNNNNNNNNCSGASPPITTSYIGGGGGTVVTPITLIRATNLGSSTHGSSPSGANLKGRAGAGGTTTVVIAPPATSTTAPSAAVAATNTFNAARTPSVSAAPPTADGETSFDRRVKAIHFDNSMNNDKSIDMMNESLEMSRSGSPRVGIVGGGGGGPSRRPCSIVGLLGVSVEGDQHRHQQNNNNTNHNNNNNNGFDFGSNFPAIPKYQSIVNGGMLDNSSNNHPNGNGGATSLGVGMGMGAVSASFGHTYSNSSFRSATNNNTNYTSVGSSSPHSYRHHQQQQRQGFPSSPISGGGQHRGHHFHRDGSSGGGGANRVRSAQKSFRRYRSQLLKQKKDDNDYDDKNGEGRTGKYTTSNIVDGSVVSGAEVNPSSAASPSLRNAAALRDLQIAPADGADAWGRRRGRNAATVAAAHNNNHSNQNGSPDDDDDEEMMRTVSYRHRRAFLLTTAAAAQPSDRHNDKQQCNVNTDAAVGIGEQSSHVILGVGKGEEDSVNGIIGPSSSCCPVKDEANAEGEGRETEALKQHTDDVHDVNNPPHNTNDAEQQRRRVVAFNTDAVVHNNNTIATTNTNTSSSTTPSSSAALNAAPRVPREATSSWLSRLFLTYTLPNMRRVEAMKRCRKNQSNNNDDNTNNDDDDDDDEVAASPQAVQQMVSAIDRLTLADSCVDAAFRSWGGPSLSSYLMADPSVDGGARNKALADALVARAVRIREKRKRRRMLMMRVAEEKCLHHNHDAQQHAIVARTDESSSPLAEEEPNQHRGTAAECTAVVDNHANAADADDDDDDCVFGFDTVQSFRREASSFRLFRKSSKWMKRNNTADNQEEEEGNCGGGAAAAAAAASPPPTSSPSFTGGFAGIGIPNYRPPCMVLNQPTIQDVETDDDDDNDGDFSDEEDESDEDLIIDRHQRHRHHHCGGGANKKGNSQQRGDHSVTMSDTPNIHNNSPQQQQRGSTEVAVGVSASDNWHAVPSIGRQQRLTISTSTANNNQNSNNIMGHAGTSTFGSSSLPESSSPETQRHQQQQATTSNSTINNQQQQQLSPALTCTSHNIMNNNHHHSHSNDPLHSPNDDDGGHAGGFPPPLLLNNPRRSEVVTSAHGGAFLHQPLSESIGHPPPIIMAPTSNNDSDAGGAAAFSLPPPAFLIDRVEASNGTMTTMQQHNSSNTNNQHRLLLRSPSHSSDAGTSRIMRSAAHTAAPDPPIIDDDHHHGNAFLPREFTFDGMYDVSVEDLKIIGNGTIQQPTATLAAATTTTTLPTFHVEGISKATAVSMIANGGGGDVGDKGNNYSSPIAPPCSSNAMGEKQKKNNNTCKTSSSPHSFTGGAIADNYGNAPTTERRRNQKRNKQRQNPTSFSSSATAPSASADGIEYISIASICWAVMRPALPNIYHSLITVACPLGNIALLEFVSDFVSDEEMPFWWGLIYAAIALALSWAQTLCIGQIGRVVGHSIQQLSGSLTLLLIRLCCMNESAIIIHSSETLLQQQQKQQLQLQQRQQPQESSTADGTAAAASESPASASPLSPMDVEEERPLFGRQRSNKKGCAAVVAQQLSKQRKFDAEAELKQQNEMIRKQRQATLDELGDPTTAPPPPLLQLLTSDVDVISDYLPYLLFDGIRLIEIPLAFIYLAVIVGWPFVCPLAVFLVLIPLNKYTSAWYSALYNEKILASDSRSALVEEIITFIRVIKYYAWEGVMEERITQSRSVEMAVLKKVLGAVVAFACESAIATPLMQFALFVTIHFVREGGIGEMNVAVVYQAISIISIPGRNVTNLAMKGSEALQVWSGIRRLQQYVNRQTHQRKQHREQAEVLAKWEKKERERGGRGMGGEPLPPIIISVPSSNKCPSAAATAAADNRKSVISSSSASSHLPSAATTARPSNNTAHTATTTTTVSSSVPTTQPTAVVAKNVVVVCADAASPSSYSSSSCCSSSDDDEEEEGQLPLAADDAGGRGFIHAIGAAFSYRSTAASAYLLDEGNEEELRRRLHHHATNTTSGDAVEIGDTHSEKDEAELKTVLDAIDFASVSTGTAALVDPKALASTFTLHIPTFRAERGDLILLVGKVGSGKTTFIEGICGGTILTKSQLTMRGTISVAPQEPWIVAGTVRNNIILDSPFDEERYRRVLWASALASDLKSFVDGDATMVASRGSTLSGGQRQRLSIARCLYRKADIYLFDDPLSALDAHVGRQVFENALCDFLKTKTRIMATHQLGLLPYADRVYVADNGVLGCEKIPEHISDEPHPFEGPLTALLRAWKNALEVLMIHGNNNTTDDHAACDVDGDAVVGGAAATDGIATALAADRQSSSSPQQQQQQPLTFTKVLSSHGLMASRKNTLQTNSPAANVMATAAAMGSNNPSGAVVSSSSHHSPPQPKTSLLGRMNRKMSLAGGEQPLLVRHNNSMAITTTTASITAPSIANEDSDEGTASRKSVHLFYNTNNNNTYQNTLPTHPPHTNTLLEVGGENPIGGERGNSATASGMHSFGGPMFTSTSSNGNALMMMPTAATTMTNTHTPAGGGGGGGAGKGNAERHQDHQEVESVNDGDGNDTSVTAAAVGTDIFLHQAPRHPSSSFSSQQQQQQPQPKHHRSQQQAGAGGIGFTYHSYGRGFGVRTMDLIETVDALQGQFATDAAAEEERQQQQKRQQQQLQRCLSSRRGARPTTASSAGGCPGSPLSLHSAGHHFHHLQQRQQARGNKSSGYNNNTISPNCAPHAAAAASVFDDSNNNYFDDDNNHEKSSSAHQHHNICENPLKSPLQPPPKCSGEQMSFPCPPPSCIGNSNNNNKEEATGDPLHSPTTECTTTPTGTDDEAASKNASHTTFTVPNISFLSATMIYLLSMGNVVFWAPLLVLQAFVVGFRCGSQWWLGRWTDGDTFGVEEATSSLAVLGIYAAALALSAAALVGRAFLWRFGTLKPATNLFNKMLSNVINAPSQFFDLYSSGNILTRFTKDASRFESMIPSAMGNLITYSFEQVGRLVFIVALVPYFAPVALLIIIAAVVLKPPPAVVTLKSLSDALMDPITELFVEGEMGSTSIRIFALQELLMERVAVATDRCNSARYMLKVSFEFVRLRVGLVIAIVTGAIIIFITFLRGTLSASVASFVLSTSLEIIAMVGDLVEQLANVSISLTSAIRVVEFTEMTIPQHDTGKRNSNACGNEDENEELMVVPAIIPEKWPASPTITFTHVTAQYRLGLPIVIHDLNLTISAGERIGVCGRTGSGKSTLIQCLLRMVPLLGDSTIIIDGVDTKIVPLERLRRSITVIPQEPVVFTGTVRFNLDPLGTTDDATLVKLLARCQLLQHFGGCDNGVDEEEKENPSAAANKNDNKNNTTNNSSNNNNNNNTVLDIVLCSESLSVGQKQLLCLCRAAVRGTNILILDEATSSVDAVTDQLIQHITRDIFAECTILTIAHRVNTIIDYDRVLVLDHGAVLEFDSPDNLMRNEASTFKSLVEASKSK